MMMLPVVLLLLLPLLQSIRRTRSLLLYRLTAVILGGGIWLAMAAQEVILARAGQLTWATALPLHLCSLMGLMALPALLTRRGGLLHALFYVGAPGAMLALLFPAIADTPWPGWTAFFFHTMHAALVCAPLLPLLMGWKPRPEGALQAWLFLLAAGGVAMAVNTITGGNYLFLAGPAAGTPLVLLNQWGGTVYRLLLALLAAAVLAVEGMLTGLGMRLRQRWCDHPLYFLRKSPKYRP